MNLQEIFAVLGIEAVKDEQAIRRAYREKLAVTNPEDNPEGFKRLRQAYEEACAYARTAEEPEKEEDDTPSGRWTARAAALYASLAGRQDVNRWRELFEDEEFLSLEGEEECRRKLLLFLLEHFRLPTEVWELLDEKLGLVRGEKELREWLPGDFVTYLIHRCIHGEDVDFSKFQGPDDGDVDAYLRTTESCWRAIQEKNYEYAGQLAAEAQEMPLHHPTADINRMYLFLQEGEEAALEFGRKILAEYPGDDMIMYHVASVLWGAGQKAEAAGLFEGLKAENDNHYMANRYLSEWYYEKGDWHRAKKCAEVVIGAGSDLEFRKVLARINEKLEVELRERIEKDQDPEDILELCWCLLQDEKFYEGLKCALSIEGKLPEGRQVEYLGYLSKVYRECAMYREAIDKAHAWREGLRKKVAEEAGASRTKDLDRIQQSIMICISACHCLGYREESYFQQALDEIAQMEEQDRRQIGVLLEQSRLYLDMAEYEKCLETVDILTQELQVQVARATAMEAFRRQWNAGGVAREARILMERFPQYVRAYDLVGKVYSDLGEREELFRLLKQARENHVESPFLEAYEYLAEHEVPKDYPFREKLEEFERKYRTPLQYTGDEKHFEEGEQVITSLFLMNPRGYILNIRGLYYLAANRWEKASADFEKILEDNPADAFAWNNLGCVYEYQGLYEKAMPCFRKAILYMKEEPMSSHYGNLAATYDKVGDYEAAALVRLAQEEEFGRQEQVGERLIRCYRSIGNEEKALEFIDKYYKHKKIYGCRERCRLYLETENWERAKEVLEDWKELLRTKGTPKEPKALVGRSVSDYIAYYGWYLLLSAPASSEKRRSLLDRFIRGFSRKQLIHGEALRALACLKEAVSKHKENAWYSKRGLCQDLAIFCALLGQEEECVHFARLAEQEDEKLQENRSYRQKAVLYQQALAALFLEGEDAAEELLRKEGECLVCRDCVYPVCTELLVVRFLVAKRKKDAEACGAILKILREKAPFYLMGKALEIYG